MNLTLSKEQLSATRHGRGPMLVLAGPGSGKTLVITERIAHLIQNEKVKPAELLVITFTKAAALQMERRFQNRFDTNAYTSRVTFGTFHAVFFKILKHSYQFNASNIIREEERYQFARELISKYRLDFDEEAEMIQQLFAQISLIKNEQIDLKHFYSKTCPDEIFRRIYQEYTAYLKSMHKIDFDDMLVYTFELFEKRKDILQAWHNKFRYILIDEFQDVNYLQFKILKMMAAPEYNLFAVGDDDQSIYHFRGARPEIMLQLPEVFSDLKIIALTENYRCGSRITEAADKVIGQNEKRYDKLISSVNGKQGIVEAKVFLSQKDQNLYLIKHLFLHKHDLQNCAVLYRTNVQVRLLMSQLMEYNIPYQCRDRIPDFYSHWVVEDVLTYIRIAMGSRRRSDFLKIMNRPNRYLRRDSLDEKEVSFEAWMSCYSEQPWIEERIEQLQSDLQFIRGIKPFAAVNYIRQSIGYDVFCKEYASERNLDQEELVEVLNTLAEDAKEFTTCQHWFEHIERFKKEMEQMHKNQNGNDLKTDRLTLSTYHSAKGLEYQYVYLVDVNEETIPYKKAVLPNEIEEERRMFYVGMTRAIKELHLYAVEECNGHRVEVSRFLKESGIAYSSSSNSSSSSSNFSDTKSYSVSSSMFSRVGLPSSSSK
ncbi:MAG: ATP-dependent helicase [Lachnospiraceae bacterium]